MKEGKETKIIRLALGTVTREIGLQEEPSFKSLQAHKQPVVFLYSVKTNAVPIHKACEGLVVYFLNGTQPRF